MEHSRYSPVFRSWIKVFSGEIINKLDLTLSPHATDCLFGILWKRIGVVSMIVLEKSTDEYIAEQNPFFAVDAELIPDDEIDKSIAGFAEKISKQGSDFLDKDYPLLKKKILTVSDLFVKFFNEMIGRIRDNKSEISDKLLGGVEFKEITSFSGDGADVHNDGKTSIIVNTDAGKFLYKPHDCKTDVVFRKIRNKHFEDIIRVPEILYVNEEFSFIEYMTNTVASTEKEAARYYENLGGFCALETFLNGSDFHEENILANGSTPVPVDFETVLMSVSPSEYKPSAEEDINRSVFRTSMFSVKSAKTPARESSPLFDLSDFNVSAPVVNGKRISGLKYFENFKKGFECIYRRCLILKEELLKSIISEPDMKIRVLLRNTNYYSLFSDEMNNCKNMKSNESGPVLKERLNRDYPVEIAEEEFSSMSKGDIPYFYCKPLSKSIFARGKELKKNFFPKTPFDYLTECMELRNEEELQFELNLIDRLFANSLTSENSPQVYSYKTSDPVERATEIFNTIKKSFFISPSKNTCFVETRNEGYPGLLGIDFSMGKSGMALFCAALSYLSKDEQTKRESLALCNTFVSEVFNEIEIIFDSEQYKRTMHDDYGVRKAIRLISKYTGKPFDKNPVLDKFKDIKEKEIKNKQNFDSSAVFKDTLHDGNAAIADVLIEKYRETNDTKYLDKAWKILLSKNRYNYISEGYPSLFCSGLMYGASGVGYELLRLANPNAIDSVFDKEDLHN